MVGREFWIEAIKNTWERTPIVWLTGVRRSGKTTISRCIPDAKYLNCDLPQAAASLADPELFFRSTKEPVVILDEVHQLPDPSRVLKIGADVFPGLRLLATGSSSLAATRKFRDSLTGRKRSVVLEPVLFQELEAFGVKDLRARLFRGGLPQALLSETPDPGFYGEWLDSYFARDVQELFRVEKREGFLRLLEAVLRQSGGMLEGVSLARACGLSRPSIANYLEVFQATHVLRLLRPYHRGGRQELLRQPKAYGFDTGFVRYVNGWEELRDQDCGLLWEHLVLDGLRAYRPGERVHFWRDKWKREVDFVLPRGREEAWAIECKWRAEAFDPEGVRAFRAAHPIGRNIVVAANLSEPRAQRLAGLDFEFLPLDRLPEALGGGAPGEGWVEQA